MASLGEDQKSYMQYIYSYLVSQEVVMRDRIDRDSEAYQAWAAETVSLREYLYRGSLKTGSTPRSLRWRINIPTPTTFTRSWWIM